MIFKTKIQKFAIIAWALMFIVVTHGAIDKYVQADKKSSEATEEKRNIIEYYFKAVGLTSGICLLAWGIPGVPMSYQLFSGQPVKPFEVGSSRRKRKKKAQPAPDLREKNGQ